MSFKPWQEIKDTIEITQNHPRGIKLIEKLDTCLTEYPIQRLQQILSEYENKQELNLLDKEIIAKLKYLIDFRSRYYIRSPYHNMLSIKLILPVSCQANCSFCYYNHDNYGRKLSESNICSEFLSRFIDSLKYIIKRAHGKPLSLDITGGEPTLNLELLEQVMLKLRYSDILSSFKRVTLTTNGYQALKAIPIIAGVVKYLNISLHDIDYDNRKKIFKTDNIPDNEELDNIIYQGYCNDVKVSSVFVCGGDLEKSQLDTINEWCANKNFVTNRIRFNVYEPCHKNQAMQAMLDKCNQDFKYTQVYAENAIEADYAILAYKNNMLVFLMDGIPETYEQTYGIEVLLNYDGYAYLDYRSGLLLKDACYLPINYVCSKR